MVSATDILSSPVIGGLAAGGLSFLGGSAQNKASAKAAQMAIKADRVNYKHRHQWEVEDLRAAGLNPILSANSAGGVPGAPTAQVPANVGRDAVNSALSAMQMKQVLANIELTKAQTAQTAEETNATKMENARRSVYSFLWSQAGSAINWATNSARGHFSDASDLLKGKQKLRGYSPWFLEDAKGNRYPFPKKKGN